MDVFSKKGSLQLRIEEIEWVSFFADIFYFVNGRNVFVYSVGNLRGEFSEFLVSLRKSSIIEVET